MGDERITLTLPMTQQGLGVLALALLIAVLTGVMFLILDGAERKTDRDPLSRALQAFGWVYAPIWLLILSGTLWALWLVFSGTESPIALEGYSSLGLGALIAALLGAPFVIWGTVLRHQTVTFQKEGHMTDRITAAVEQLGAEKVVRKIVEGETQETSEPNIEVRIGAILSLERIAQDSTRHDNGRDHVRVMEILCAYIRENSNARKPVDFPLADWQPLKDDASEEERAAYLELRKARFKAEGGPLARQWAESLPKPRADVQLALTVIGRRSADQRRVEAAWPDAPTSATAWPFDADFKRLPDDPGEDPLGPETLEAFKAGLDAWKSTLRAYRGYRLDLRGANLQGADMAAKQPDGSDAVFSGARLDGTRMEGADLSQARMEGADLTLARMEGADLSHARMEGAGLRGARMEGASLRGARMEGADLEWARMEGAGLEWARMEGAVLLLARMEGALLGMARMEGADLSGARMEGADLKRARMEGAVLWGARMDSSTSLSAATLRGAALRWVDYSSVPLSEEQVRSCFGDASVIRPEGIAKPDHWPDWELPDFEDHDFDTEWRNWQDNPDSYTPPPNPDP
ncbi:pentapeptide repeat-containing protein [Rhodobacteraceae bacterium 2376]|uniref:Pentapeptide repeat-containing protein n=1 Tax=Rhabdonatronobacter sediminivivens TaxID=2743469 RepID=A0A7Z0HXE8_9RHOB|nr:pentapeptide repeat-containing protein [Rhabdonatronobacter sediminivivens]NYS23997.1 pentapeptide repeat-containing protein [Rhabdonatronobacter sediminivivens]